jgi:hypothetical protein
MRKVFLPGLGSLILSGLLVTQSWAGAVKSDLLCSGGPFDGARGTISIKANGDVKGSLKLPTPVGGPIVLECDIFCGSTKSAGPVTCAIGQAGDKTLKINAPGLGATLGGTCFGPAVTVGADCESAYTPPAP